MIVFRCLECEAEDTLQFRITVSRDEEQFVIHHECRGQHRWHTLHRFGLPWDDTGVMVACTCKNVTKRRRRD